MFTVYRLMVIGYWLLVIENGYWLLVIEIILKAAIKREQCQIVFEHCRA